MKLNLKQIPKTVKTILTIDPSADHMAYVISEIDWSKNELIIVKTGMIWCKASWIRGQKLLYIHECLKYILNDNKYYIIDMVVTEQYFFNPRLKTGSMSVIPTVNGIIQMLCAKYNVIYIEIPPPTWRSILGIKSVTDSNGKRDWKTPVATFVNKYIKIPNMIVTNTTLKDRKTPHDVSDVLAITLSLGKYNNLGKLSKTNTVFSSFGYTDMFNKILKELL